MATLQSRLLFLNCIKPNTKETPSTTPPPSMVRFPKRDLTVPPILRLALPPPLLEVKPKSAIMVADKEIFHETTSPVTTSHYSVGNPMPLNLLVGCLIVVILMAGGEFLRRCKEANDDTANGEEAEEMVDVSRFDVRVVVRWPSVVTLSYMSFFVIVGLAVFIHYRINTLELSTELIESMVKFVGPTLYLFAKLASSYLRGRFVCPETLYITWFLSAVHFPMIYHCFHGLRSSCYLWARIALAYSHVLGYIIELCAFIDVFRFAANHVEKMQKKEDVVSIWLLVIVVILSFPTSLLGTS